MRVIKSGVTEVYDYTCEEIKQRICPICKAVYEYTDSECETIEVENPTFLYDSLRYYSSQINLPYRPPAFQPVRGGIIKTITCPCCLDAETLDLQMIY